MTTAAPDLIVLHEHPEWQKPLFAALQRRGMSFEPFERVVDFLVGQLARRGSFGKAQFDSSDARR